MKIDDITRMCRSIAYKYRNYNEYEDLVSEGVLAVLEYLEKDPMALTQRLYRVANGRMHDYLNIDSLPVTVPASDVARTIARDNDAEIDLSYSPETVEYLRSIFKADRVEGNYENGNVDISAEEAYLEKERLMEFNQMLRDLLTPDQNLLLYMRYVEGMSQEECAGFFGLDRTGVAKREARVISKLKEAVTKMQQ